MPTDKGFACASTPSPDILADPLMDGDLSAEELVEYALAGLPEPFDPQGRLKPLERLLGNRLIDEGFQPTRVYQLDAEAGGLWEIRVADTPDLAAPAAARTLKHRLRRAIAAASIAPLTALTEVFGRRGLRRFVFCTRPQQLEGEIVDAVDPD